jgi:hypothetical protein
MKIENLEDLRKGQKVRISFEAEFRLITPRSVLFDRGHAWGNGSLLREGLEIEVIEPEYVRNGIYQDAKGTVWRYESAIPETPWVRMGSPSYYSRNSPAQPLTRLVPEVAE